MSTSWTTTQRAEAEGLRRQNQCDRVRDILRSASEEGVCTLQWNALGLVNARNRIGELRDPEGEHRLDIESVSCDLEAFHAEEIRDSHRRGRELAAHTRYVYHWNKAPRQLSLLRATEVDGAWRTSTTRRRTSPSSSRSRTRSSVRAERRT